MAILKLLSKPVGCGIFFRDLILCSAHFYNVLKSCKKWVILFFIYHVQDAPLSLLMLITFYSFKGYFYWCSCYLLCGLSTSSSQIVLCYLIKDNLSVGLTYLLLIVQTRQCNRSVLGGKRSLQSCIQQALPNFAFHI